MSFLHYQLAWVFHRKCTKTIIYEAFGGRGPGDVFLFGNFCSSFLSFFGWRMGYCCLTCHLYVLFTRGFYKRSHYHIWFIFYCKCPFKSICFNLNQKKITRLMSLVIIMQQKETLILLCFIMWYNYVFKIGTRLQIWIWHKFCFLELSSKAFKAILCCDITLPYSVKEKNVEETKHSQLTDLIRIGLYIF